MGLMLHGERLVSCAADATVRTWRAAGLWEAMQVLDGHGGPVWCMAAQGGLLVTGASDCTVKLWALRSEGGAGGQGEDARAEGERQGRVEEDGQEET